VIPVQTCRPKLLRVLSDSAQAAGFPPPPLPERSSVHFWGDAYPFCWRSSSEQSDVPCQAKYESKSVVFQLIVAFFVTPIQLCQDRLVIFRIKAISRPCFPSDPLRNQDSLEEPSGLPTSMSSRHYNNWDNSRGILPIALVFIPLENSAPAEFLRLPPPHATKAPEETSKPIDEDLFKGAFRSAVVVECLEQCVEIGLRFALQHNIGKIPCVMELRFTTLFALLCSADLWTCGELSAGIQLFLSSNSVAWYRLVH